MPGASARRPRRHGTGINVSSTLEAAGIIGLWRYDVLKDLVFSNHAMAIAYGVDPALAARGVSPAAFRNAIHPDDLPNAIASLKTATADGVSYHARYRLIHAGGAISHVEAHGRPFVSAGKTVLITGANFDVTDAFASQACRRVNTGPKLKLLAQPDLPSDSATGVSAAQLGAARHMLNWSVTTLSEESGVSCMAINRLERSGDIAGAAIDTALRVKAALEAHGVDFCLRVEGDGGVRRNG